MELNTFVWASAGVEPVDPEDAVYEAGEQPVAGYDNYLNWAVTNDLHDLNEYATNHAFDHQAGGGQEIDLDGLGVGSSITIEADGREYQWIDVGDGEPIARINPDDETIRQWPDFHAEVNLRNGATLGGDLTNATDDVLYDYGNDRFHRAEEALEANWADESGNAELFQQKTPDEFLQPDVDAHVSAKYSFGPTVDTDISGHASTASYAGDAGLLEGEPRETFAENAADQTFTGVNTFEETILGTIEHALEADHATTADTADWADNAGDSELHEGYTVSEILSMAEEGFSTETILQEDATTKHEEPPWTLSFNDPLSLTERDAAGEFDIEVGKVDESYWADESEHAEFAEYADVAEFAETAEYSSDSNKVDGYHAHEIIEMARSEGEGRWTFIDAWEYDTGSDWQWNEFPPDFDQYRLVVVNQPSGTSDNRLWLRLNGDSRSRYYYFKHNRTSDYFLADNRANYWPVCLTRDGYTSYGEYILTMPPQPGSWNDEAYPQISRGEFAAHPRASGGTLDYGHLETNYSEIDQITLQPQHTSAAYVALWGCNFPTP